MAVVSFQIITQFRALVLEDFSKAVEAIAHHRLIRN